jgi:uncharacterized protein (DUF488 family)
VSAVAVATIGFTKTTAEHFFARLKQADVRRLVDVRLYPSTQLSGFAKSDDLAYFLKALAGIGYAQEPVLAPSHELFDRYKKGGGAWADYEREFLALMRSRKVETRFRPEDFDGACLLCSEATAEHCHRRLVVEYLAERWDVAVAVRHL